MPNRFTELQLTAEAVEVLKASGIANVEALAQANVTDLQEAFILAAKEKRYPDKFPSLVKIAAWVEQSRTIAAKQPDGGPSTDLDNIPTAVIKPEEAKKKSYSGSGLQSKLRQMELRPDRHRPKKDPSATSSATGDRVTLAPRAEEPIGEVLEELNPDRLRTMHHRRQAPTLLKSSGASTTEKPPVSDPTPTSKARLAEEPESKGPAAPAVEEAARRATAFRSFDDYKEGRVAVKPLDRHSLQLGEDTSRSTGSEQESKMRSSTRSGCRSGVFVVYAIPMD